MRLELKFGIASDRKRVGLVGRSRVYLEWLLDLRTLQPPDRSDKAIAPLRDGLQKAWGPGVVAERLPEAIHRLIDSPLVVEMLAAGPQDALQLFAGHQTTGAVEQHLEQKGRLVGNADPLLVPAEHARFAFERETLEFEIRLTHMLNKHICLFSDPDRNLRIFI